jgi:hypothetical protein
MKGSGQFVYDEKKYQVQYTSDIVLERYGNFTLDVSHPDRRVTAHVEGGQFDDEGVKRVKVRHVNVSG